MSNGKFTAFGLDDQKNIDEILVRFPMSDIHYDPRYLKLFQDFNKQRAVYFHYYTARGEFLLAFFERPLPVITGGGEKDLLSPWYYGGPIHTFENNVEARKEYGAFLSELDQYANANGIVSQFQRFNPVLDNYQLYGEDPGVVWNRKVVSIDLTKSIDTIFNEYERDVRRSIRRARDKGMRVVVGNDEKSILEFKKVYIASMSRKHAGSYYYFNDTFFNDLFTSFPKEAQLFTLYVGEEVVTSELVIGKGDALYHYLRGTNPEYLPLRPNGFAVHAIVEWAAKAGYKEFNMGGGLTAAHDDPVFAFKKSLSPFLRDYYLYKKVHNRQAYAKRCEAEGKSASDLGFESANPFPEYKTS